MYKTEERGYLLTTELVEYAKGLNGVQGKLLMKRGKGNVYTRKF